MKTPTLSYTQIADLLDNPVIARVLVTRPRGSWKWQDAYAISTYRLMPNHDETRVVWKLIDRTGKLSLPQIKRYGMSYDQVGR
jgi:hypothetical protein